MHLTILNAETQKQLDKCTASNWFEAIQYVETNKQKYDCSRVLILNKRSGDYCSWAIISEPRPHILNDKMFKPSDYGLKDGDD